MKYNQGCNNAIYERLYLCAVYCLLLLLLYLYSGKNEKKPNHNLARSKVCPFGVTMISNSNFIQLNTKAPNKKTKQKNSKAKFGNIDQYIFVTALEK